MPGHTTRIANYYKHGVFSNHLRVRFVALAIGIALTFSAWVEPAESARRKVVGILEPVYDGGGTGAGEYSYMANQIASACEHRMGAEKQVAVAERRDMARVLNEHKMVLAGLTKGKVNTGALVKADYLIAGKYSVEADQVSIYLKLIRVNDGQVAASQEISGPASLRVLKRVEAAAGLFIATILNQRTVPIVVRSDPPGADVFIDDNFAGRTPVTNYYVPPREVELTIKKEYYREVKEKADLSKADKFNKDYDLVQYLDQAHPIKLELSYGQGYFSRNDKLKLFNGGKVTAGYSFAGFEVSGGVQFSQARRLHSLSVFGKEVEEDRNISIIYPHARVLWHLRLFHTFLYPFVGAHGGVSVIRETLYLPGDNTLESELGFNDEFAREYYDKNYVFYQGVFTGGPIAGFDIIPNQRVAVRVYYQYDFRERYRSRNGKFNPVGQKRFEDVKVRSEFGNVFIGVRVAI